MGSELGILLAVGAGLMVGNCMLPLNYQRRWRWENTWIIFTLVALVLMPWALAFLRVPNLLSVYSHVNSSSFLIPFLYGAGWGVAQVLFGLAVIRAGMAVSFAITVGLSAALGSLVPILLRHPQALVTGRGLVLLLGQVLMVTGVIVCCWAGRRREKEQKAEAAASPARSYVAGISLAALAGLLAPMLNYSLAFGDNLILEAIRQNTLRADAPYAVWPIALSRGGGAEHALSSVVAPAQQDVGELFPYMARDHSRYDHGTSVDGFRRDLWDGHDITGSSRRGNRMEHISDLRHCNGKRLRLDCR